jgi:putative ABC transport system substrate-binding protein
MNQNKPLKSRRKIIPATFLIMACLFISGCGEKEETEKVYRVGIVSGLASFIEIADGFKGKMTELGYIEGENIVYDLHELDADPAGEKLVARKFVEDKVDLIFAFPTGPSFAAKAAAQGTNIPVVFAMAGIEGNNLVESVPKPGGNMTGVRFPGPEMTVKRLDILHELVPQANRIYIIYDRNYPNAPTAIEQLHPAIRNMGLTLVKDPVNNLEELRAALQKRAALDDIGIDAILMMPDILTHSSECFGEIMEFANKHKVPVAGTVTYTADRGAVFSYGPDTFEIGMLAAIQADKIFKGTPAGTIMVVTPTMYLRLNYRVIEELGLEVSEGLLSMAKEIIR